MNLKRATATLLICAATTFVSNRATSEDKRDEAPLNEAAPTPKSTKPLDLRAPDIKQLLSAEQLAALLAAAKAENLEGVEVEGKRDPSRKTEDEPWGGLAAPIWALLHPDQAWRILTPVSPKQAEALNSTPDVTSLDRPVLRGCQMSPC